MVEPAIQLLDVTKRFGSVVAVDRASLEVGEGEILALLGPSGCGKTTLLRLIAGFERPDSGALYIGGRLIAGNGIHLPPERRRVGMVFQDYALFPHLDVRGNVAFGLPHTAARRRRVEDVLELVGLADMAERMPHELSGGQQQRVALARALAPAPEVILLDEPFSNLDSRLRAQVRAEVRQILLAAGRSAVFVTHDQEEAFSLADRVAVMWAGAILQTARPQELYHRPGCREVASFVGDANFLPGLSAGDVVECELGRLSVFQRAGGPGPGPVDVMVRPESLRLDRRVLPAGVVVERAFYGHDQVVALRLPSGYLIRARLGPFDDFTPGEEVGVAIDGDVMVFDRRDLAPS